RNARAQAAVKTWIFEKADDLSEFLLCLVNPCDVGKSDFDAGLRIHLGATTPDRQKAATRTTHRSEQKHPSQYQQDGRHHPRGQVLKKPGLRLPRKRDVPLCENIGDL